jgi:two-component system OmpR family response regulator
MACTAISSQNPKASQQFSQQFFQQLSQQFPQTLTLDLFVRFITFSSCRQRLLSVLYKDNKAALPRLKRGIMPGNYGKLWQVIKLGRDSCFNGEKTLAGYRTGKVMKRTIAIVEDEPSIRANYTDAFIKHGYAVMAFANRADALKQFSKALPDLAIIDIGLGDEYEGGFDLCRELRAQSREIPIIFLTARDSEPDQISGLRLGADDYLTKDISIAHMMARIVALFRRMDALRQPDRQETLIERGDIRINLEKMSLSWKSVPLDLTVTEFWILYALVRHPGHVKNRTQLMEAANTVLDDSTITSHIKRIRKKFQQIDPAFDAIQTAYGMGYRWQAGEP